MGHSGDYEVRSIFKSSKKKTAKVHGILDFSNIIDDKSD